jgi:hypothetical protein
VTKKIQSNNKMQKKSWGVNRFLNALYGHVLLGIYAFLGGGFENLTVSISKHPIIW